jgi:hypothetical protein
MEPLIQKILSKMIYFHFLRSSVSALELIREAVPVSVNDVILVD